MREGLSVSVCRHRHQTLCKLLQSERCVNPVSSHVKSQSRTVLATSNAIIQLLNKEDDMMKEAYVQSIECEEPC